MANDLSSSIRDLLIDFLAPLRDAARNQNALADWLATPGHTPAISGDSSLLEIARRAQPVIDQLSALDSETLKSWTGLASILQSGKGISDIQRELREFAEDPGRAQIVGELAKEIMSLLLASYLRRRHPVTFRVASLLTLIEAREAAASDSPIIENGATIRYSGVLDRFKVESVSSLISHPGETLKNGYFPNEMATGAEAISRVLPANLRSCISQALATRERSAHTAMKTGASATCC